MKKLLISILLVLFCAGQAAAFSGILAGIMGAGTSGGGGGGASYDVGINFWSSSTRGTLGSNETYALAGDVYPTSRGGATIGWVTSPLRYDDNASESDRRLLSLALAAGGSPATFRVSNLPNGTYRVWIGAGDDNNSRSQDIILKDDATTRTTIAVSTDAYVFADATGTIMGSTAWASAGGSYAEIAISSGILNVVIGTSGTTSLNYIRMQKQ